MDEKIHSLIDYTDLDDGGEVIAKILEYVGEHMSFATFLDSIPKTPALIASRHFIPILKVSILDSVKILQS